METVVPRCAGLDVAKDEVVACVRVPDGAGGRRKETRTFRTFTADLEALADWLDSEGVTQVVMEATGPYWKPCWYVLEERGFDLMLVNARHVKIVPGRKTDCRVQNSDTASGMAQSHDQPFPMCPEPTHRSRRIRRYGHSLRARSTRQGG